MAVIPIYNCFHPVLREKALPVINFDDTINTIVNDMFDTMYNTGNGVGLAANQVGRNESIFIVDLGVSEKEESNPLVLINPKILSTSDYEVEEQEGCLSIPQFFENVSRPESIEIEFTDLDEHVHRIEVSGFLARVMQHENDHLNALLFFDRLPPIKRMLSKSKLKRIERGDILVDYPMILPNGELINPDTNSANSQ